MRKLFATAILPAICIHAVCQTQIWLEDFNNACTSLCLANGYTGSNGSWSVSSTGTNDTYANEWFVSCAENGNPVGSCGSGCGADATLHIANISTSPNAGFFCPSGDCGAAYDAGGWCGFFLCVATSKRAESPTIDLSGYYGVTLRLKYMENGQGSFDNATLDYFDGSSWSTLLDLPKTSTSCSPQGKWTEIVYGLPPSAANNPNVKIGFNWVNNDDGIGNDPSFAVDEIELLVPGTEGLIVNEISNGPSGTKEYYEMLVVGAPCTTLDIRNWLLDDNNGACNNGFSTTQTGAAVSDGHLRFANIARWSSVPVGSLILIYNDADLNPNVPPDDVDDTSPNDSIYILPISDPGIEFCANHPASSGTDCRYGPCTYSQPATSTRVVLRNNGDAFQSRYPNSAYFHGIAYGSASNNMTAGPDNINPHPSSGSGDNFYFSDTDYRDVAYYSQGSVPGNETPGAANNAANAAYIKALKCPVLPVEFLFFNAEPIEKAVELTWATASEMNSAYFIIERSKDLFTIKQIGKVKSAGNSSQKHEYQFTDRSPIAGVSYYRLQQQDVNGHTTTGNWIAVAFEQHASLSLNRLITKDKRVQIWFHPVNRHVQIEVIDLLGRTLMRRQIPGKNGYCILNTEKLQKSIYLLRISDSFRSITRRFKN